MATNKNYKKWIKGFETSQFNRFIKLIIKVYFKVDDVVITDGTNDGGIDLKIFEKLNKKIPLQSTTQENTFSKLKGDLIKISELIEKYHYSDTFYFFYSYTISEKKCIEITEFARNNYGIELKIFDNNVLSSFLDDDKYYQAKEFLFGTLGYDLVPLKETDFDENKKMQFDLISHFEKSIELKERFIISKILTTLFNYQSSSFNELYEEIKKDFGLEVTTDYLKRLIGKLKGSKKVNIKSNKYFLFENEKERLKLIHQECSLKEREFNSKIQNLISKHNVDIEIRILIIKLEELFTENYNIDLKQIDEQIENYSLVSISFLNILPADILIKKSFSAQILKILFKNFL